MAGTKYAIKQAMNVVIKEYGSDTEYATLDYSNSGELSIESENDYALMSGQQSIVFPGAKTGTITLTCDVTEDKILALMVGGVADADGNIVIDGISQPKVFSLEGTIVVTNEDGTTTIKTLKAAKVAPETSASLAFGFDTKTEFSLVFTLLYDATNDKFVELSNPNA